MIDTAPLDKYIAKVQDALGKPWLVEADNTKVGPFHTVGSIAKSFAISSFMVGESASRCIMRIKAAFPEKDDDE